MSLECGDESATVLLQLQDRHLTGLVSYESVSGLHVKSGRRMKSKKTKPGIHFHDYQKTTLFSMQTLRSRKTFGGKDVNMLVDAGTLRVSAGELELVNGPRL